MEEMNVKVSVIIPVYNPGNGINKCIEFLQHQSLKEIEMIFVDDCGTDDAIQVIKKVAEDDPRIRVIQNETNVGAGSSRNRGIESACGEYLAFVDPDDYIATDFLELLYEEGVRYNADIVKGICKNVNESGNPLPSDDPYLVNKQISLGLVEHKPLFISFTFQHTTAIYRREMIISKNIRYAPSSYSEDSAFLLKACCEAQSFRLVNEAVYYYVSREKSSVRNFSTKRWEGTLVSLEEMLDYIAQKTYQTSADYWYVSVRVVALLNLQQYYYVIGLQTEAKEMLKSLGDLVRSQPYSVELAKYDSVMDALISLDVNLSVSPYGNLWRKVPYVEYEDRVNTWVTFLRENPEFGERSQSYLWRVFENAITYDGFTNREEKKAALRQLRKQAKSLPDKKVLTKGFISMRLFVDFGIDVFYLRKTILGEIVRSIATKARNLLREE